MPELASSDHVDAGCIIHAIPSSALSSSAAGGLGIMYQWMRDSFFQKDQSVAGDSPHPSDLHTSLNESQGEFTHTGQVDRRLESAFHTGPVLGLGWWPSPNSGSPQQAPSGPRVKFWSCKKPRVQTQMPEGTLNKYNCTLSTQVCFCLYINYTEIFFNSMWKHALYSFFFLLKM